MNRRDFIQAGFCLGSYLLFEKAYAFNSADLISKEELIGKGSPVLVGDEVKFLEEVYEAFIRMREDAKKSGILIYCVSAYRSFSRQKSIWERKYRNHIKQGLTPQASIQKIVRYSTIPGTSRHHWGTDIDIVDGYHLDVPNLLSPSNFEKGKPYFKLGQWLREHASEYGFYQVYTDVPGRRGFNYEPWHYSFKPMSVDYLKAYKDLDILSTLKAERFEGSEFLTNNIINDYIKDHILDINPELLP